MQVGMIVTLDGKTKYFLADETVQAGIKYFLANKLDEKENLTENSDILKETKNGDDTFLNSVEDKELFSYLSAVFTANLIEKVDEME